jgi:hypothetical protein
MCTVELGYVITVQVSVLSQNVRSRPALLEL